MHNEELKSAYLSLHISRMIKGKGVRWVAHVARMAMINAHKNLVEKLEGKRRRQEIALLTERLCAFE